MDNSIIKGGLEVFTAAIGSAKALVGLTDAAKNCCEVKQQADEVLNKLIEARQKHVELQDKYCAVVEENRQIRAKLAENSEVDFHDGAYWSQREKGEEGPFCPSCWDREKTLARGQVTSVEDGDVHFMCGDHARPYLYRVSERLVKDIPLDSRKQRVVGIPIRPLRGNDSWMA